MGQHLSRFKETLLNNYKILLAGGALASLYYLIKKKSYRDWILRNYIYSDDLLDLNDDEEGILDEESIIRILDKRDQMPNI